MGHTSEKWTCEAIKFQCHLLVVDFRHAQRDVIQCNRFGAMHRTRVKKPITHCLPRLLLASSLIVEGRAVRNKQLSGMSKLIN
jgi:hypothetical protein